MPEGDRSRGSRKLLAQVGIVASSREEKGKLQTAAKVLRILEPLFFREPVNSAVHEISFFFSPKVVKVDKYRRRYEALKAFLAKHGVDTAQPIITERR